MCDTSTGLQRYDFKTYLAFTNYLELLTIHFIYMPSDKPLHYSRLVNFKVNLCFAHAEQSYRLTVLPLSPAAQILMLNTPPLPLPLSLNNALAQGGNMAYPVLLKNGGNVTFSPLTI